MMIYVVSMTDSDTLIEIPAEGVLWWVRGVADSYGARHLIDPALDPTDPAHTQRMQALQIGAEQHWFSYRYVTRES